MDVTDEDRMLDEVLEDGIEVVKPVASGLGASSAVDEVIADSPRAVLTLSKVNSTGRVVLTGAISHSSCESVSGS